MKRKSVFLPLLIIPVALFSFCLVLTSGIKGTISPAENAGNVWAISETDSLKVTPVQGVFEFNDVKAGIYKIIVEGKEPYKDFVKENVEIKDGEVLDLGSIVLTQ